jgi:hypothetical protein
MTTPLEPALPAGADPFMRRQGIQQIRDKVQDCGKAALCPQAGIPPIEAFHSTPHWVTRSLFSSVSDASGSASATARRFHAHDEEGFRKPLVSLNLLITTPLF